MRKTKKRLLIRLIVLLILGLIILLFLLITKSRLACDYNYESGLYSEESCNCIGIKIETDEIPKKASGGIFQKCIGIRIKKFSRLFDPGLIHDYVGLPPDYEDAKGQSVQTKCSWRPTQDYGLCEMELGVYYNGEECVMLSGCDDKGDKIPFNSIEECKALLLRCNK